jgi:hypothetical protein
MIANTHALHHYYHSITAAVNPSDNFPERTLHSQNETWKSHSDHLQAAREADGNPESVISHRRSRRTGKADNAERLGTHS